MQAKAVGNVTALACMARLLDAGGRAEEGLTLWRKCAKAGVLEGQLRLGLALYRGTCGAVPDAEEAHMYLNRAVKQVRGCLEDESEELLRLSFHVPAFISMSELAVAHKKLLQWLLWWVSSLAMGLLGTGCRY